MARKVNAMSVAVNSIESAILLAKLKAAYPASDPNVPIRDIVPAAILKKFIDEAHAEAPLVLRAAERQLGADTVEAIVAEIYSLTAH